MRLSALKSRNSWYLESCEQFEQRPGLEGAEGQAVLSVTFMARGIGPGTRIKRSFNLPLGVAANIPTEKRCCPLVPSQGPPAAGLKGTECLSPFVKSHCSPDLPSALFAGLRKQRGGWRGLGACSPGNPVPALSLGGPLPSPQQHKGLPNSVRDPGHPPCVTTPPHAPPPWPI